MPDRPPESALERALDALMAAHPELEPLAALVLLALRERGREVETEGMTTSQLSRRLDIEHALIRRAAAELEAGGWVTSHPVGGASPSLRLFLVDADLAFPQAQ